MFTLTIHLDEKDNIVQVHGVPGKNATDGEKNVAGRIAGDIKSHLASAKFSSDIEVTSPKEPMDIEALLAALDQGVPA